VLFGLAASISFGIVIVIVIVIDADRFLILATLGGRTTIPISSPCERARFFTPIAGKPRDQGACVAIALESVMKVLDKVVSVAALAFAVGAFSAPSLAQTTSPEAAAPAPAYSITGNVSLTTDYTFRGLSQTNDNPAIQGGLDFAMANGFYLGTWASNIDFGFPGQSIELDLYGGYKFKAGPVGLDIGVIDYVYPGIKDCGVS
jgi:hypothetical protein